MFRPMALGAILALYAIQPPAAHAAPPPPPPPPEAAGPPAGATQPPVQQAPVEVVVTGTRTPETLHRAPVRTDVVTREEADRRGATTVGEALAGQLGVQVNPSAYGYLGRVSAIQMQGFDRERVLVLEDGERVIGDTGGAVDLASIPLTDVSRVELVSGPSSALYGASAIGGVVNVLSAPPEAEGWSGRASLEGRIPLGLLARASGAYRRDDTWAALDTSIQRRAGIALDDAKPDLTLPSSTRSLIGLRAGTRLAERIALKLRARWLHDDLLGLETQRAPGLGTYLVDLPERTDRFALHLIEDIDIRGGGAIRLSASRQWFTNTADRDLRASPRDELRERWDAMHSFELVATLPNGPSRAFMVGARLEVEQFEQQLTATDVSPRGLTTRTATEVPTTSLGSAAVFGQLRWTIADALTILPGVRAEGHLRYGGVLAPRLALAFAPHPSLLVRASVGRGFRAPGAKEFGFDFDHSLYGYRVEGNPDLVPETSWGVNGDVTLTPHRGLTLRGSAFGNWVENLIDFQLSPAQRPDGVTDYRYANVGRARTFGLQIDAAVRARSFLRAEAGYAYLWTRDDTDARPLEGRPPHTGYAALTATLPFQLEAVLRFRAVTDAFTGEDARAPGFATIDARLSRPLWARARAYAGVQNILGARKDPARLGDARPIEGRTIYIGLSAEAPWRDR